MMMTRIADFSEWQGTIDFAKVKGQVDLVILRVQAGSSHADVKYKEYVAGCKANGIKFGTYAYFKGVSITDAIQEAKDAFSRMDADSVFFALDIEQQTCKNPADLIPAGQAYIAYLKQQGVQKVGLYSGEYFYRQYGLSAIKADFTWLANYGANDGVPHTPPTDNYDLWQFTSSGKIAGVSTSVDLSQLNDASSLKIGYFLGEVVAAVEAVTEVVAPPEPPHIEPVFCMNNKVLGKVKALVSTDIRKAPDHRADYVRDTHADEIFDYYDFVNGWYNLGTTNWADSNGGRNMVKYVPTPPPPPKVYYKVVSGDTAGAICKRYGCSLAQLKSWNNLNSIYTIYIGQTIRVK